MLLCDSCHDKSAKCFHAMRSRGACEGCGIVEACVDCKAHHDAPEMLRGSAKEQVAATVKPFRVGDKVRTAAGVLGVVEERNGKRGRVSLQVRHQDGTAAPYSADELSHV